MRPPKDMPDPIFIGTLAKLRGVYDYAKRHNLDVEEEFQRIVIINLYSQTSKEGYEPKLEKTYLCNLTTWTKLKMGDQLNIWG